MGHKTHGVTGPTPEIYSSMCVWSQVCSSHLFRLLFPPTAISFDGSRWGRARGGGSAAQTQTREQPPTAQWRPVCAAGSVEKRLWHWSHVTTGISSRFLLHSVAAANGTLTGPDMQKHKSNCCGLTFFFFLLLVNLYKFQIQLLCQETMTVVCLFKPFALIIFNKQKLKKNEIHFSIKHI